MFTESFLQDLRIGLRVLIKEKTFCALAAPKARAASFSVHPLRA